MSRQNLWILAFTLFGLLLVECTSHKRKLEDKKEYLKRHRRADGFTAAAVLGASITPGASLMGTTVKELMSSGYNVACSGSIENYSRWTLTHRQCTIGGGVVNRPMGSVQSGEAEGFASHKIGHTATGSYVSCQYSYDTDKYLNIMYSVPFNHDHYVNTLAIYLTEHRRAMSPDELYYNEDNLNDGYNKKEFYKSLSTLRVCRYGVCVAGSMGSAHRTTIDIKFYPTSIENASSKVKTNFRERNMTSNDYRRFINVEFKGVL